jgi:hypothetical protein
LELTRSAMPSVSAVGVRIDGPLMLDSVTSPGQVDLAECRIEGSLSMKNGVLGDAATDEASATDDAAAPVLRLDLGRIEAMCNLDDVVCYGETRLAGTRIGGQLNCSNAIFVNPGSSQDSSALLLYSASIANDVLLKGDFVAIGQVNLDSARIEGSLFCSSGTYVNDGRNALNADSMTVTLNVFLNDGFHARGQVRMHGATIDGQLNCRGGRFINPGGNALHAEAASVASHVLLDNWWRTDQKEPKRFRADGRVNLFGATIGGVLRCSTGSFRASTSDDPSSTPRSTALELGNVVVTGSAYLDERVDVAGTVTLVGARFDQDLTIEGSFDAGSDRADALVLKRAQVATKLKLMPHRVRGVVDLTGFGYQHIEARDVSPRDRIRIWLRRQVDENGAPTWIPRPYEQLASTYRAAGLDAAARRVGVERGRARREEGLTAHSRRPRRRTRAAGFARFRRRSRRHLSSLRDRSLRWLGLDHDRPRTISVGYGHWPRLTGFWLLGFCGIVAVLIDMANGVGAMRPLVQGRPMPELNPVVYAMDLLVPVVDLGQRSYWQPEGSFAVVYWVSVIVGWTLITAVVAGMTSVFRRS